jgi:hypothetical protein
VRLVSYLPYPFNNQEITSSPRLCFPVAGGQLSCSMNGMVVLLHDDTWDEKHMFLTCCSNRSRPTDFTFTDRPRHSRQIPPSSSTANGSLPQLPQPPDISLNLHNHPIPPATYTSTRSPSSSTANGSLPQLPQPPDISLNLHNHPVPPASYTTTRNLPHRPQPTDPSLN